MKVAEQNNLRFRVYEMIGQRSKQEVVKHFISEGYSRTTIYNIICRYAKGLPSENKKKSGRPSRWNKGALKCLETLATNNVGQSIRKLSRRFGTSKSTISRNLKKMDLRYFKRDKVPKYSVKQIEELPSRCRKLRRKFLTKGKVLIMDDEKYFTFSNSNVMANRGFYAKSKSTSPDSVKHVAVQKFEIKVLVWCAISEHGISQLFIQTTKHVALNSALYIKHCLTKLDRFIKTKHQGVQTVFWPDLASCHYAAQTLEWLEAHNIHYVSKDANLPNVPVARPIEHFWALLSQIVYENNWSAQNPQQLKSRILRSVRKIDMKVVQDMMSKVKYKVRKIEEGGPLAIH